ncbi:MAG: hypothetical protein AAF253_12955 [Pseudomonadota bacterium]
MMNAREGLACIVSACAVAACNPLSQQAEPPHQVAVAEERDAQPALVPVQGSDAETQGGRETVQTSTATIDWDAARTDLASRGQSDTGRSFQIESGAAAPPVPVLLPTGIVSPASADRPIYRGVAVGYFAKSPGADYDITISGTNEWYSGGTEGRDAPATEAVFTRTMSGAQVSLNRYGAAYLIEFDCNRATGAAANACIGEAEAMSVANQLVIAGSR